MAGTLCDPAFASYKLSRTSIPVLVYQIQSLRLKMSSSKSSFQTPPPQLKDAIISFPRPSTLLITLNRPEVLNCISDRGHFELDALYTWYDNEPSLTCAILTGSGEAFCSGADPGEMSSSKFTRPFSPSGFGGLSLRKRKKPVICAVNGVCLGRGFEMVILADIVDADESATFALSEVKLGLVSASSGLVARTVGREKAMEMSLTGRKLGASEAKEWGLVNKVVQNGRCVEEALKYTEMIDWNSPDSVIAKRQGVNMAWHDAKSLDEGLGVLKGGIYQGLLASPNLRDGVEGFVEKRKPKWVGSKL